MKLYRHSVQNIIESAWYVETSSYNRSSIIASITHTNISNLMNKVKSSNVWSMGVDMNSIKDDFGDVYVQFRSTTGGPGDIYLYYEVPSRVYRSWIAAPSKGHFFWRYIRNRYKYAKLTGDKRGKLPNAVN
jgi:hypothetical protein